MSRMLRRLPCYPQIKLHAIVTNVITIILAIEPIPPYGMPVWTAVDLALDVDDALVAAAVAGAKIA